MGLDLEAESATVEIEEIVSAEVEAAAASVGVEAAAVSAGVEAAAASAGDSNLGRVDPDSRCGWVVQAKRANCMCTP